MVSGVFFGWLNQDSSLAPQEAHAASWYNSSWSYRKKITVDNTRVSGSSNLSNFPVLINATSTDWLHTGFGGKVGKGGGEDILFTSSDGTTKLNHEIERYASSTGELVSWVNIPTLQATTDTDIYVYYGNASASNQQNATSTWNGDYKGVWHLKEDPSGTAPQMKDSTSSINHGSSNGSMTASDQVSAKVNGGLDFDGGDDYVTKGGALTTEPSSEATISAWIKPRSPIIDAVVAGEDGGSDSSSQYSIVTVNTDDKAGFKVDGTGSTTSINGATTLQADTWYHIAGVYQDPTMTLYVNAVIDANGTEAGPIAAGSPEFRIGANISGGELFNGLIDEVRIANVALSSDWIATDYNNQSSPSTFYTISQEEGSPTIQFTSTSSSGSEGVTSVGLELSLSETANYAITVNYAVTGGTATGGGTDYTLAAGTATISANSTSTTILITVADDNLDESDETIIVNLSNPTNATLGSNTTHTYTITDNDDPPSLSINDVSATETESIVTAIFTITLSAASGKNVSVDYATSDGTATAGSDYTAIPATTLTITAGNTTSTVSVTVLGDTLDEDHETFNVNLSSPVNATITDNQGVGTIVDNDSVPSVSFDSASSSGSETVTSVNLAVSLSTASSKTVTVAYSVTGGTATGGGVDYTFANGTATISAGDTTTNIALTVVDDSLDENNETIEVTLSSPSNATLGANTVHTYTITDDDAPSSPADTTAPVISSISASPSAASAVITWSTDEAASSQAEYGKTPTYGSQTTEADTSPRVTNHSVAFQDLSACTTYHYRVKSSDASSNQATSSDNTFKTTGCDGADTTAPAISAILSSVTNTGATITWTTDESASSRVEYGTSSSYGSQTSESDTSPRVTSHSVSVSGLSSCTTYHYRVKSTDASSNQGVSSDNTFRTNCVGGAHLHLFPQKPQSSSTLPQVKEGGLLRGPDGMKVWIVNAHGYKRHIFNPHVFSLYGHLRWENIKSVDQATLDALTTSDLYRADGDYRVFSLKEIDEVKGLAQKRWLNITPDQFAQLGFDWNQVFAINTQERDYYQEGSPFTFQELNQR